MVSASNCGSAILCNNAFSLLYQSEQWTGRGSSLIRSLKICGMNVSLSIDIGVVFVDQVTFCYRCLAMRQPVTSYSLIRRYKNSRNRKLLKRRKTNQNLNLHRLINPVCWWVTGCRWAYFLFQMHSHKNSFHSRLFSVSKLVGIVADNEIPIPAALAMSEQTQQGLVGWSLFDLVINWCYSLIINWYYWHIWLHVQMYDTKKIFHVRSV